jgi:hypothetical protein
MPTSALPALVRPCGIGCCRSSGALDKNEAINFAVPPQIIENASARKLVANFRHFLLAWLATGQQYGR